MLPRYYEHVGEHENTLITKFFGVHRLKLKWGKKVRTCLDLFYILRVIIFCFLSMNRCAALIGTLCGHGEYVLHRVEDSSPL